MRLLGRMATASSLSIILFFMVLAYSSSDSTNKHLDEPTNEGQLNPIVLVPGDGGSQIEAKLDKPRVVHIWCSKKTDYWFPLWLNVELVVPHTLDCLVDNLRLTYDPITHTTHNQPGVQLRQPGFGNTSTVEWLDSSHLGLTSYFYPIVESLVQKLGYVRNKSIRGAPYDFRKAPNENQEFLQALKNLIEETHEINNNSQVVLFGHSIGSHYIYYLLRQQSQAWKDKYIKSFIALSAPWGGTVKSLQLMASGEHPQVPVLNRLGMLPAQHSYPSSAWLMPHDTFWNETEVLITGSHGNYTVKDYKRFFDDIHHNVGYMMRQDTEGLIKDMTPPGVDVHCIHGNHVDTPEVLNYSKEEWYDDQPDVTFGLGDGTVNLRSLYGCLQWEGKQGQHRVIHKEFSGRMSEHMKILDNEDVKSYLISILKP